MSGGITPVYQWAQRNAHIPNEYVRETLAEFLGTTLLCFMVVGSGMQAELKPDSHAIPVLGTILGLMVCIIIFGGISGAHINPAVSLGMALAGELKWMKLPLYIIAQIFGGFLGSLLAYGLYRDHLFYRIDSNLLSTNTITIPDWDMAENGGKIMSAFSPRSTGTFLGVGLATEITLTAILLMAVMAATDKGNMKIPSFLMPFMLALTVGSLAMAHNLVTGTLLNPARDMSPRLAAWTLGWDSEFCFKNTNFKGDMQEWWVVGVFGPLIGAPIGVLLYSFLVGAQLTNNPDIIHNDAIGANNGKSDNGDWRNTVFIPRTGVPANANYGATPQNQPPVNGHGPGQYNPGYIRDDTRQHQGY